MATLKKLPEGESTELFLALVDKVIVGEGLTFVLRDGKEQKGQRGYGDEPCLRILYDDITNYYIIDVDKDRNLCYNIITQSLA